MSNDPQSLGTWQDVVWAIMRLQDTTWGHHGDNGLVGTQKAHAKRLEALEGFQKQLGTLYEMARWIALGVAALAAFLLSDPVSTVLAKIWRVLQ